MRSPESSDTDSPGEGVPPQAVGFEGHQPLALGPPAPRATIAHQDQPALTTGHQDKPALMMERQPETPAITIETKRQAITHQASGAAQRPLALEYQEPGISGRRATLTTTTHNSDPTSKLAHFDQNSGNKDSRDVGPPPK